MPRIKNLKQLLWWIASFVIGLLLAPRILSSIGLQTTLVNQTIATILVASLVFSLKLLGTAIDMFKPEEKIRLLSRKYPELRARFALNGIIAIYLALAAGVFIGITLNHLILSIIFIFLIVALYIEFLLILSLLPKLIIGLEGQNDIEFLKIIARVLRTHNENIPDLEKLENDGDIIFLLLGGSNLKFWGAKRLEVFNRQEFYIFDRDNEPPAAPKYQDKISELNKRNRSKAVSTSKRELENYLHPTAIKSVYPETDVEFSDFDDVGLIVAKALHNVRSSTPWNELSEKKVDEKIRLAKKSLNKEVAEKMTADLIDARDTNGEIRSWLSYISQKTKD